VQGGEDHCPVSAASTAMCAVSFRGSRRPGSRPGLAQEGAQDAGEVEADIFVGLDSGCAGEVRTRWGLSGGDVDAGVVDLGERGVERGGLCRRVGR